MNASHKIGKKRNRLSRCKKRLSDKELTAEHRNAISARLSELELELNLSKTK